MSDIPDETIRQAIADVRDREDQARAHADLWRTVAAAVSVLSVCLGVVRLAGGTATGGHWLGAVDVAGGVMLVGSWVGVDAVRVRRPWLFWPAILVTSLGVVGYVAGLWAAGIRPAGLIVAGGWLLILGALLLPTRERRRG